MKRTGNPSNMNNNIGFRSVLPSNIPGGFIHTVWNYWVEVMQVKDIPFPERG